MQILAHRRKSVTGFEDGGWRCLAILHPPSSILITGWQAGGAIAPLPATATLAAADRSGGAETAVAPFQGQYRPAVRLAPGRLRQVVAGSSRPGSPPRQDQSPSAGRSDNRPPGDLCLPGLRASPPGRHPPARPPPSPRTHRSPPAAA